jgi:hypothetical protein
MPEGIEPMARVVVVKADRSNLVIVTLEHLRKLGAVPFKGVRLTWRAGQTSALVVAQIAKGRDVGTVEAVSDAPEFKGVPLPYDVTFAFFAHAFHPDVPIEGKFGDDACASCPQPTIEEGQLDQATKTSNLLI